MKYKKTRLSIIKLLFSIAVFSLWSAVIFLASELWTRTTLFQRGNISVRHFNIDTDEKKIRIAYHQDLWIPDSNQYKPLSLVKFSKDNTTYEININSMGFRGAELNQDTLDKDTFIIACIGGSTTANGPMDNKTYPALLQEYLKNSSALDPLVINCGIAGIVSKRYNDVIYRLLNRITPDMVIEYNAVNDICGELFPYWEKQLSPFYRFLLKSQLVKSYLGDYFLPDDTAILKDIDRLFISNLRRIAAMLEGNDIKLAVCSFIFPDPESGSKDELIYLDYNLRHRWGGDYISFRKYCKIVDIYNDALKNAFQGTNVIYLPLAESDTYTTKEFYDICHMNDAGIKMKAHRLAILLKDHINIVD